MGYALNVQSAGSQITGNKNLNFGITEGLHNSFALGGRHFAMKHINVIALHAQPVAQLLGALLAHAENNHQIRVQAVNKCCYSLILVFVGCFQANLLDFLHGSLIRIDINQRAVFRQLASQLAHLFRQSCGAKHRLMLRRGHSNQLQRFIHKALLQHFVNLV